MGLLEIFSRTAPGRRHCGRAILVRITRRGQTPTFDQRVKIRKKNAGFAL
jgi:hypothetical protein